jgi:hypothetical protein
MSRIADTSPSPAGFPSDRMLPSLIKMAETSLTVGDIAVTDPWGPPPDWTAKDAYEELARRDFDYSPVDERPRHRFVTRAELKGRGGKVDRAARVIDATRMVTATLGLANGVSLLGEHDFYFVLSGNEVSGIVTRADIQQAPVSMVALSFILAAEVGMNRLINGWLTETWDRIISPSECTAADKILEDRRRHNAQMSLLDCLPLRVRMKLLLQEATLKVNLFPAATAEIEDWKRTLIDLRNTLAHGGSLLGARDEPTRAIELFERVRAFAREIWHFPADRQTYLREREGGS